MPEILTSILDQPKQAEIRNLKRQFRSWVCVPQRCHARATLVLHIPRLKADQGSPTQGRKERLKASSRANGIGSKLHEWIYSFNEYLTSNNEYFTLTSQNPQVLGTSWSI